MLSAVQILKPYGLVLTIISSNNNKDHTVKILILQTQPTTINHIKHTKFPTIPPTSPPIIELPLQTAIIIPSTTNNNQIKVSTITDPTIFLHHIIEDDFYKKIIHKILLVLFTILILYIFVLNLF